MREFSDKVRFALTSITNHNRAVPRNGDYLLGVLLTKKPKGEDLNKRIFDDKTLSQGFRARVQYPTVKRSRNYYFYWLKAAKRWLKAAQLWFKGNRRQLQ